MLVCYIRCSTIEQNEARQVELANKKGAEKIFIDKASGKNTDRENLKKMLDFVREGDIVLTESISRIARNTVDLLKIVNELNSKGVAFVSDKEAIDTNTPQGKFMLTVFGALAELERESTLQRQREGIEIAKAKGDVYKGRKPKAIDVDKLHKLAKEWRDGKRTAVSIQKEFGITGQTFYRWVKQYNL